MTFDEITNKLSETFSLDDLLAYEAELKRSHFKEATTFILDHLDDAKLAEMKEDYEALKAQDQETIDEIESKPEEWWQQTHHAITNLVESALIDAKMNTDTLDMLIECIDNEQANRVKRAREVEEAKVSGKRYTF